jgi:Fe-S-cluster containining protein
MAEASPPTPQALAARDPELRENLEEGLRFIHLMGDVTRREVYQTAITVFALIEEMRDKGVIDDAEHTQRTAQIQTSEINRMNQAGFLHVMIEQRIDKYAMDQLPDIDCDARIPLCNARCCTLHFPLSNQDLDERVVKWDYLKPYIIRQRETDGYCVHNDPGTFGCTVYHNRPAVCRTYDCRQDKRIWIDFDKRIPAIDPRLRPKDVPVPHGPPPKHPQWPKTDGDDRK